jgi:hypothetical protein
MSQYEKVKCQIIGSKTDKWRFLFDLLVHNSKSLPSLSAYVQNTYANTLIDAQYVCSVSDFLAFLSAVKFMKRGFQLSSVQNSVLRCYGK